MHLRIEGPPPPIPAQDRGPFWFLYILHEILQYIEIWNEF